MRTSKRTNRFIKRQSILSLEKNLVSFHKILGEDKIETEAFISCREFIPKDRLGGGSLLD